VRTYIDDFPTRMWRFYVRSRTNTRVAAAALAGLAGLTLAAGAAEAGNGKPPSGSSTGTGQVFFPNPVASLQNQSLTDQNDADYAALAPAYRTVTLTNLDGSGYLVATGRTSSARPASGPTRRPTPSSTGATTTGSSR
jgi:hypothetical protein